MSRTLRGTRLVPVLALLVGAPLLAAAPPPPALGTALQKINDSKYGGRGADPIPLQPTALRLRSAEVTLTEVPVKDAWQVAATYEIWNPVRSPAALSLLLPEEGCPPGRGCSAMAGTFADLGTRFGDQLIEPVAAPAAALRQWADHPGQGYLYQISVPPGQTRRLSQEYRFDLSEGTQLWGVHYLSSAGRWGGAVDRVRYVIELKHPTLYVIHPRTFKLVEFSERENQPGAGSITRLVFTAEGLSARTDFLAIFPADAVAGATAAGYCQGFRGDRDQDEVAQVLRRYDAEMLRACRDRVHALHGAPFADPAQRARAYGAPPRLPAWADPRAFAIAPRPEDRSFRESYLSPGEQAYIRALNEAGRRRTK